MTGEQHREDQDYTFGKGGHDEHNPTHSGDRGHFCPDWDDLWICIDCREYATACSCFPIEIEDSEISL